MITKFKKKRISGILGILPQNEFFFDDEVDNYAFPPKQTLRLKKVMGYEKHRLAKKETNSSDFCVVGLQRLLDEGRIQKEQIGAIVVVSLSPDYYVPHISNIIHGKLELSEDVICIDISQGCCGFLLGLMQSFMLLEHMNNKKVLLFNADVLSHKVSTQDRNDFPLIGDAASVTIIENSEESGDIDYRMFSDGSSREALIIPAGGFAMPSTQETAVMSTDSDGNSRCLDNLHMDGAAVFNFVQTKVPPMINKAFEELHISREEIDYYLFHQPNKFMLKKLADKLEVPYEKMFMNVVENYGNPSGVSIPINIAHNLSKEMCEDRTYKCCLSAFGSGLAWGMITMDLGKMDFCELITSDL